MNLALQHAIDFQNKALEKIEPKRIVVQMLDDDKAYAWIFSHPEQDGTHQIKFYDEPKPVVDYREAF